jgi:hypothetical protein
MSTSTKILLAAALILGPASAVLANEVDTAPNAAQSERDWKDYLQSQKHMGNAGTSYGSFGSQQDDVSQSGKKNRNR